MFVGIISNLLPLSLRDARVWIINYRHPHSSALNVGVNVFALLVTHSLVTLWPYSQDGLGDCNLGNVIFHDTLVVLHAVNLRAVFEGLVKIPINLDLVFHFHNLTPVCYLIQAKKWGVFRPPIQYDNNIDVVLWRLHLYLFVFSFPPRGVRRN